MWIWIRQWEWKRGRGREADSGEKYSRLEIRESEIGGANRTRDNSFFFFLSLSRIATWSVVSVVISTNLDITFKRLPENIGDFLFRRKQE